MDASTIEKIEDLLRVKTDGYLYHRESKDLEFKEQFNFAGLEEYFRDFAAFSNNVGGIIIFGVSNSPRRLIGMNEKSCAMFEKIDPETITGKLLEIFAPDIVWEQYTHEAGGKKFGCLVVDESNEKPVVAKKTAGRDNLISSGDIFFRYGGRTQKIQYSELNNIIHARIENQNVYWSKLISKIAKIGPANAAILDTEAGVVKKDDKQVLVIDRELSKKLKFLKEGCFTEKQGATALRLVGDVTPVDAVEIERIKEVDLLSKYPLSFDQLKEEVLKQCPECRQKDIFSAIKENAIKSNPTYSNYNFRTKRQREDFEKSGMLPKVVISIYNNDAVSYIVELLNSKPIELDFN